MESLHRRQLQRNWDFHLKLCWFVVVRLVPMTPMEAENTHPSTPIPSLDPNGSSSMRLTGRFGLDPSQEANLELWHRASLPQNQYWPHGWPNLFQMLDSNLFLLFIGICDKVWAVGVGVFEAEVMQLQSLDLVINWTTSLAATKNLS